MRIETWGGLRVCLCGGSDREGGGDGPAVVLLHGFGAGGDDLVPLWRVLQVPGGTRFVFPEGALSLPQYGSMARAWWHLDVEALERAVTTGEAIDRSREEPAGLASARAAIVALLDELPTRLSVPDHGIVLGGFSQGAMLSCDVALRTDRKLAGLVLLSGSVLTAETWASRMTARRTLPIFQAHGRQDPLLPFEGAVRLRDMWLRAGCHVEWVEFNGGHEIPAGVLERLGPFLTRALTGPAGIGG